MPKTKTSAGSIKEVDIRTIAIEPHPADIVTIQSTRSVRPIQAVEATIADSEITVTLLQSPRISRPTFSRRYLALAAKSLHMFCQSV